MPRVQSDDMGYNELNYMNATRGLSTPNIDALATTGVAFHNWCAVLRRVRINRETPARVSHNPLRVSVGFARLLA